MRRSRGGSEGEGVESTNAVDEPPTPKPESKGRRFAQGTLQQSKIEVELPRHPARDRPAIRGVNLLIVEHDIHKATALAEQLRAEGVIVAIATGSSEALARVAMRRPDVVIVDVNLQTSTINSVAMLLEMLRDLAPGVPAIVMSGHDREHLSLSIAIQSTGACYIEKPIDLQRLLQTVEELLDVPDHDARVHHES